jgi:TonB family protein
MKPILITIAFFTLCSATKAQQTDSVKKSSADTTIYDNPATPPEFPGGRTKLYAALYKNVHYPAKAKEDNIQGIVVLDIVIEKDGSITNISVKKSVAPVLDNEVIRIVKLLPKFIPGKDKNGQPVRCYFDLPYSFTLVTDN